MKGEGLSKAWRVWEWIFLSYKVNITLSLSLSPSLPLLLSYTPPLFLPQLVQRIGLAPVKLNGPVSEC